MNSVMRFPLVVLLLLAALARLTGAPPLEPVDESDEADEALPAAPARADPRLDQYWEAVRLLERPGSADQAAGRRALQAAADRELTHAQVLLAGFHFTGSYGFKRDLRKAANLMQLAAARGNGFARVSLGVCHLQGIGVSRSDKLAAEWLQAALAADADFERPVAPADVAAAVTGTARVIGDQTRDPANVARATAQFLLGALAAKAKNRSAAHAYYLAAANAGPAGRDGLYPAAIAAALNYAFGQGVPRDAAKANELLATARRLSARAGVTVVHNYSTLKLVDDFAVADLELEAESQAEQQQQGLQLAIANALADRKSKDYNPAEAVRWYEIAAESNQTWAMFALGILHSRPGTPVHDPARAFHWFERAGGGEKTKHVFATMNLAICLQHGLGTAADPARAAALFQRHRSTHYLGHLGANGRAPAKVCTDEDVLDLIKRDAKKKEPHAEYFLGLRHLEGLGVDRDLRTAVRLLERATKAGVPEAMLSLGNIHENAGLALLLGLKDPRARAHELYQRASDAGLAEASASFAYLAGGDLATPPGREIAEAYYLRALTQDPEHTRAHNNLAAIYKLRLAEALKDGESADTAAWREKMLVSFQRAAELGFGLAAHNLGDLHREGKLVPADYEKAYEYYDRATALGHTAAHYALGQMHDAGQGVPITPMEAAYHYRLAALAGHRAALRRLVDYYLTGQVADVDLDRGVFWVRYAIMNFFEHSLGRVYCDLLMQKGDYATLLPILKDLTDSSDPALASYAHGKLSALYRDGLGVKPSARRARRHAELAEKKITVDRLIEMAMVLLGNQRMPEGVALMRQAAQRSAKAKFYLGQMFYFGTNVEKDPAQAVTLLRAAAKENHADAQYFLAALTYKEAEGAPSLAEALEFAAQSERGGRADAAALRRRLEARQAAATAPAAGGE